MYDTGPDEFHLKTCSLITNKHSIAGKFVWLKPCFPGMIWSRVALVIWYTGFWCCGGLLMWCSGAVVIWCSGDLVLWWFGAEVIFWYSDLVLKCWSVFAVSPNFPPAGNPSFHYTSWQWKWTTQPATRQTLDIGSGGWPTKCNAFSLHLLLCAVVQITFLPQPHCSKKRNST